VSRSRYFFGVYAITVFTNFELSHRSIIPKTSLPVNYYPYQIQIQPSSLTLYALPYTDTAHFHSIYKDLISRSPKAVSHNLLELLPGPSPSGTHLYRKITYVGNAAFGILSSADKYNV